MPKSFFKSKGDPQLCPSRLQLYATSHHTTIGQYNQGCYELLHTTLHWTDADDECRRAGGHLVTINDVTEQTYIQAFMLRHNPRNDAWIGLFDTNSKGTYHWLSGKQQQIMRILRHIASYFSLCSYIFMAHRDHGLYVGYI